MRTAGLQVLHSEIFFLTLEIRFNYINIWTNFGEA